MGRLERLWDPARWGIFGVEFGVVVVGVMIAFALNSWWQGRADAAREEAHLRALQSDFERNVEALHHFVELEERISQAAVRLLDVGRRGETSAADSVLDLMRQVFSSNRFQPAMGAYETLVNSGDFSLIRDDTLRRRLGAFASALQTRYFERAADEIYIAFTKEFMGRLRFAEWSDSNPPEFSALLRDARFQDHLALRHYYSQTVARYYRNLSDGAEAILARLRTQLGTQGDASPQPAADAP